MSKIGLVKDVCGLFNLYVDTKCCGLGEEIHDKKLYDCGLTELFKEKIRKDDLVIDIGAHVGYFTCLAASLVGEYGEVIAFEPSSENYELLRKNIQINGFGDRVKCFNSALGSISDIKELHLSKDNTGGHSLRAELVPNINNGASESVNVISLYTFLGPKPISFIKIDVQGYELEVLKGCDLTYTRIVWCELWSEAGQVETIKQYLLDRFGNIKFV